MCAPLNQLTPVKIFHSYPAPNSNDRAANLIRDSVRTSIPLPPSFPIPRSPMNTCHIEFSTLSLGHQMTIKEIIIAGS